MSSLATFRCKMLSEARRRPLPPGVARKASLIIRNLLPSRDQRERSPGSVFRTATEALALGAGVRGSNASWWLLGPILLLFVVYLRWLGLENYFGQYHDDTVYFSSAQAMAQGRGYILPSIPGTPPQTKYPILYSWLLSAIWKWRPIF